MDWLFCKKGSFWTAICFFIYLVHFFPKATAGSFEKSTVIKDCDERLPNLDFYLYERLPNLDFHLFINISYPYIICIYIYTYNYTHTLFHYAKCHALLKSPNDQLDRTIPGVTCKPPFRPDALGNCCWRKRRNSLGLGDAAMLSGWNVGGV